MTEYKEYQLADKLTKIGNDWEKLMEGQQPLHLNQSYIPFYLYLAEKLISERLINLEKI